MNNWRIRSKVRNRWRHKTYSSTKINKKNNRRNILINNLSLQRQMINQFSIPNFKRDRANKITKGKAKRNLFSNLVTTPRPNYPIISLLLTNVVKTQPKLAFKNNFMANKTTTKRTSSNPSRKNLTINTSLISP